MRAALLTTYKSFLRRQLDYGDVIYDCAFNESFQSKLEFVQYNQISISNHRSYQRFLKREALPEISSCIAKITAMVPKIVLAC